MECNKKEAVKAKSVAEKKFADKDIVEAKRFALKAQSLYPDLDGITQFLATLDVFISAEQTTSGEVDWYKVLGVDPLADDDTIRKHYRKLALLLHPDKNKSVGADGAFKIISDAWSLLSDKIKKIAYDQKQKVGNMYQRVPNWTSHVPNHQNGFHNIFNCSNSYACTLNGAVHSNLTPSHSSKSNTFWTTCDACKLQFEYLRVYMNRSLCCHNCRYPFIAVETPPPPIHGRDHSAPGNSFMRSQNCYPNSRFEYLHVKRKNPEPATSMGAAVHPGAYSSTINVGNVPSAAFMSSQHDKLKRNYEEASVAYMRGETFQPKPQPHKKMATDSATRSLNPGSSSVPKGEVLKKKRHAEEQRTGKHPKEKANQMGNENGDFDSVGSQKGRFYVRRSISTRELSQLEVRNILMEKSKKDIRAKINEWNTIAAASRTSAMASVPIISEKEIEKENQGKNCTPDGTIADASKNQEFVDIKIKADVSLAVSASDNNALDGKDVNPLSMIVSDPDFHDFDHDRSEMSFAKNQVWAAYDDDDGMPRYYAMIHQVMSLKPFKVQISWLNSKSNHELAPINWIGSGFYKTIGDFWIGKREVNKSLNSFSHKVKWTKGLRGTIKIFPRKGDVWALYRNWSPNWNELTPDEVIHKYDMVEVLKDYNEERGVTVVPLIKVAGLKTVFRWHFDPTRIRTIPKEEMFRFSHMVPSYMLTGHEGQKAPKGCWELDPASTPLELLQVLTEVQVKEMVEIIDKVEEEAHDGDCKRVKDEELVKGRNILEGNHVQLSARDEELVKSGNTLEGNHVQLSATDEELVKGGNTLGGSHVQFSARDDEVTKPDVNDTNKDKIIVYKRRRYRK
ncbi:hypothetical protein K2173_005519 [Erythroxylum novogranatense]|uniref:J domain-containing protein n=1 Tax=Erythroxylum novogranatense TaxID=1862640 RepID=A0AAV8SKQ3_9ROSI|nr:hypothetical protein K2173_005519 [Erythroxylum novogranatense]